MTKIYPENFNLPYYIKEEEFKGTINKRITKDRIILKVTNNKIYFIEKEYFDDPTWAVFTLLMDKIESLESQNRLNRYID